MGVGVTYWRPEWERWPIYRPENEGRCVWEGREHPPMVLHCYICEVSQEKGSTA